MDITQEVTIKKNTIVIPGALIDQIVTSENDAEDISVPGLVMKIISK
jgi:acyl CoA:acetate/3-ketoacid CoA transferase